MVEGGERPSSGICGGVNAAGREKYRLPTGQIIWSRADASIFYCAHVLQALGRVDEIYQAPVALFYLEDCS